MAPCLRRVLAAAILAALAGCAAARLPLDTEEQIRAAVPFVVAGATTREDLVGRLGAPAASFEQERILVWHVTPADDGQLRSAWDRPSLFSRPRWYALTVIFDPRGFVARFRLVSLE